MSKSNANKRTVRQPDAPLVEALLTTIEPFIAIANNDPLRASTEATDTGHEAPALRDKTFAYLVSMMAQNAHNQLYGQLRASDGRTFDNAKTWLEKARTTEKNVIKNIWDEDKPDLENKMAVATNSDWIRTNHYVQMNQAKCQALEDLIYAFAVVYKVLSKEDWKPRQATEQPVSQIKPTDAEQTRLLKLLEDTLQKSA